MFGLCATTGVLFALQPNAYFVRIALIRASAAMQSTMRPLSMTIPALPKPQTRTCLRCRQQPRAKIPARGFTSSAPTQATMMQSRTPKDIMSRMPMQKSMKARMQELPQSELPDDFGFLPQTFVWSPATSRYPTFLKQPRVRLRLEWYRAYQGIQGWATFVVS